MAGIEAAGRADDPQKEAPCWRKRLSALRAALRCFAKAGLLVPSGALSQRAHLCCDPSKVQGTDVLSQDSQDGSRFGQNEGMPASGGRGGSASVARDFWV